MSDAVSLYLHIPFCQHRCAYCDFNTYTGLGDLKADYAAALSAEVRQVGEMATAVHGRPLPVSTVFFGGGTPSLLAPPLLEEILSAIREAFSLERDAEISMEANPNTVDEAYLGAVRKAGLNRLSFGVQSAIPAELALLERQHTFAGAVTAVAAARAAGFTDLNLDLIYGLPGQTLASWEKSLNAALALDPAHLSLYCLTVEPGTPLQRRVAGGKVAAPDPDLAADQYQLARERLATADYVHYEISNWAKPGKACRHNLTYWRNQSYLGLGAGAHGHAAGYRYALVKQPRVYLRRMRQGKPGEYPLSAATAEARRLSPREAMSDTVITQLRLLQEGLDLAAFAARFGVSLDAAYDGLAGRLAAWGLVWEENGRLRLTERGYFLSNQVFYRFMDAA
jgi:oxygen-independent coproporphyrinogen-3 oxidase